METEARYSKNKIENSNTSHLGCRNYETAGGSSLVNQQKSKYTSTEADTFETARNGLDQEQIILAEDNNFQISHDVSQDEENVTDNSSENSKEIQLHKEYKSKIKILSDIHINSPILSNPNQVRFYISIMITL